MANIFTGKQSSWLGWWPDFGIWGGLFWQKVRWSWCTSGGETQSEHRVHVAIIPYCRRSWDKGRSEMDLRLGEGDRFEEDWRVRARAGRVWWGQTPPSGTFVTPASTRSWAVSRPFRTGSPPRLISAPASSPSSPTTPSQPQSTVTSTQTISASEYSSIPCAWRLWVLCYSFKMIRLQEWDRQTPESQSETEPGHDSGRFWTVRGWSHWWSLLK